MSSIPLFLSLAAPCGLVGFAIAALLDRTARPATRRAIPLLSAIMLASTLALIGLLAAHGAQAITIGPVSIFRLDPLSATLFSLVAFIGTVVLGFSRTYLDGESRQGPFLGWVALTLAAVLSLVIAGHLLVLLGAWIATSVFLHRLLLFYPNRPGARRAARKKFIFARLGDGAVALGIGLLWIQFETFDIAQINASARIAEASGLSLAAGAALALAALLKSAQFPTHGWLTEVMETPTPVSALLHAGVINAGGFLLIRFGDVMLLSPGVLAGLVMIGGFTALFGGLVMLTQPAVKTSLAWSTIAQMGFMIFQCGLALFPLALLHIVAHSLYKAHAFLGSGGAVARVAAIRRPGPIAVPGLGAVSLAFAAALALYGATAAVIGLEGKSPQAIALGAILIFGVAYLLAQGFADRAPRALTAYTAGYATLATLAYFALQTGAEALMAGTLPPTPAPGPLEWALIVLALVSFAMTAFAQATFPLWSGHPAVRGLRVHLVNGLYVNALTDRWLGHARRPDAP